MPTFNTTDPKPGFVYDLDTDTWFPLLGLATQSLDGLTDVTITTPTTGQILAYNGTAWINQTETGDISAVTSGTGITVTNGTGPIPTIAVDTTTIQARVANVTDTEIGYLDGVTSAIQTQLDSKASASSISDATTTTAARGAGYMGVPPSSAATTGSYTIVAGDAGEHIYSTATRTITVPANTSVAFPVGTAITFVAATGSTVTIAITSDTLLLAGAGTTGSRTLAPFGMATALKITSTSWIISGNGLS
jgi:hypothetical protein